MNPYRMIALLGVMLFIAVGAAQAQTPLVPHETFPDCDHDGNADLFWNNMDPLNNDVTVWYMAGPSVLSTQTIAGAVDKNWRVEGLGDYKNTQKPQIIWRNQTSGRLVIWWSNQCPQHTGGVLEAWSPTESNLDWKIQSVSDLGSVTSGNPYGDPTFDHLNDLVWQFLPPDSEDINYGQLRVWYTEEVPGSGNGFVYEVRAIVPAFPDSNDWLLVGGGDFGTSSTVATHDDHTDLLFENQVTGALQIWYMNSNVRVEKFDVPLEADKTCRVVAVADYGTDSATTTRDVDADIVFACETGYLKMWFMQGSAWVAEATVSTAEPGGLWQVVHPQ